jgi:ribosomal protein S18 acetylase RimI-like enzyme
MDQRDILKAHVRRAFAATSPPDPGSLRGSGEGEEPFLLEDEFREVPDWRTIDTRFLDQAPDGYGSALSFFSPEAFRYYLPAYLLADLDEALCQADPLFHLWFGLDDERRGVRVNEQRYGRWTWFQAVSERFSAFTVEENEAIVAYLEYKAGQDEFSVPDIEQALRNYWLPRARGGGKTPVAGDAVRRLGPEDAAELREVRRRALETAPAAFESGPGDDRIEDRAFVEALLADTRQAVFGAFDDALVGFVGVMPAGHVKTAHRYDLWGLFVDAGRRGHGLGRALVDRAVEFACQGKGATAVCLSVTEAAPEALGLYRSVGFVEWGYAPDAIRVHGESFAEVHMRLDCR